jgi:hypothetical protein
MDEYVERHAFLRKVRLPRQLRVNSSAVLCATPHEVPLDEDEVREVLSLVYAEVCTSWRELVGVRFKLLGLVPAVSVFALGTILARNPFDWVIGIPAVALGLIVTCALAVYDQRNSQLHDELISRGRRIEYELGMSVGQFLGRPGSVGWVKHDIAILTVYVASVLAWVGGLIYILARL